MGPPLRKRWHLSDLSPVGSLSRSYVVQLWNVQDNPTNPTTVKTLPTPD